MLSLALQAKVAQLVEHDLAKVGVAGSNPVFRSKKKGPKVISALSISSKSLV